MTDTERCEALLCDDKAAYVLSDVCCEESPVCERHAERFPNEKLEAISA